MKLLFCALAVLLCFVSSNSFAIPELSATATARIATPISITSGTALNFGAFIRSGVAGTVTISTAGVRTSTNVTLLSGILGYNTSAGTFSITGDAGPGTITYTIAPLPTSIILNGTPSGTMTVNTFTSNPAVGANTLTGGAQTLNIGATLQVGANQAAGTYTGTYTISVAY